jgi:NAD(P) transhydrogenase subunit alpha
LIVGVVKETYPGERRVALVPGVLPSLSKKKISAVIEAEAGEAAGFPDAQYVERGATIVNRGEVFAQANVVAQVRTLGANPAAGSADLELMRPGQVVIGFAEPLTAVEPSQKMADRGVRLMAMELMPRTTRAQMMDALSSQATVQGYKAVLVAASHLPKMFPLMMTAAGTIAPAKVFIIGAGVAGLQAIATSRKLGGVVSAYDIRPVVKEQVESLGARFVELPIEASGAQDKGGYAKAMDDTFMRRQQELMSDTVAASDVVITTAAVPGKRSPVLVTKEMVQRMQPGSVIIDLAAERGGNCELSKADETVEVHGVTILGPTNLAATVPYDASQMYARNMAALLQLINKDGELNVDTSDDIVEGTLVTDGGRIVHRRLCEIFNLPMPVGAVAGGEGA